jgi:hypothetical protein
MVMVYASDAKVKEILERHPRAWLDIVKGKGNKSKVILKLAEILPFFSIGYELEFSGEPSGFENLKKAVGLLNEHNLIGTVEQPASYFYGNAWLRRTEFTFSGQDLVFFGGLADHTLVALAGSLRHVAGYEGSYEHKKPTLETPALWWVLLRRDDSPESKTLDQPELDGELKEILGNLGDLASVQTRCRFVARKEKVASVQRLPPEYQAMLRSRWNDPDVNRVLLGSPLFVEEIDEQAV